MNSLDQMNNNLSNVLILGRVIANERKKRRLTQTQLAELSNTSINFISQIESGKVSAHIGKVLDVLTILGLELHIKIGSHGVVNHVHQ